MDLEVAVASFEASDRTHQLAGSGALDADQGHDLAGTHVQVDRMELALVVCPVLERQDARTIIGQVKLDLLAPFVGRLPHDQLSRDPVLRQVIACKRVGTDAIEDDRHARGVGDQLSQPMTDAG